MEDHEKGRDAFEDEDAYRLHCLRHSTAHVMAQAIQRLKPEVKLAIGPPIEDGFYYDIEVDEPFTEDELPQLEQEMKRICKENQTFEEEIWDREQALAYFEEHGQTYKIELIKSFDDDAEIGVYKNYSKKTDSTFLDLCRGPHVMRTKQCKNFKLLKLAGAYWRGDAKNQQLQRIYGTVWKTKDELDQYLYRLEEAKKRDHRRLGVALDMFLFHDYAPGSAFWLPRGEDVYNTLATRMRTLLNGEDYWCVRTPMVFDQKLWQTSGHWGHYRENMFHWPDRHAHGGHGHQSEDAPEGDEEERRQMGLKPMNCPSHMLLFRSRKRSYRDLPIRIHDQGVLHRNELSGALSGLTRVRQFCQDDAHHFCTEDQIGGEVQRLLQLTHQVYSGFDLGYKCELSTRPEDKLGDDALWDKAEDALRKALEDAGLEYEVNEGDGAFYGPKIDFQVLDALGRSHQCATIQLDFQIPLRFELSYVGADNANHTPVVIHRAIFGSFERFIGILIEHFAGAFPVWLAPEQVRVMTVSEKSETHGDAVFAALKAAGIKTTYDNSSNKIGYKIRECHGMRVPYMAIIGEKEQEAGTVSVRNRDGDDFTVSVDALVERVLGESEIPF